MINKCKKKDDNDSGISSIRSLKSFDQGCGKAPVLSNSDQLDLLILKLDKVSQNIGMILNKELFRHHSLIINSTIKDVIKSFEVLRTNGTIAF